MMPTLLSLVALEVVIMTTSNAINDNKVGIMATLGFSVRVYPIEYAHNFAVFFVVIVTVPDELIYPYSTG